jgi:hypothetical protein
MSSTWWAARREADRGRPWLDERIERVEQELRPHQVDLEDPPHVGHRRRDARGVYERPERSQLARPRRELSDQVAVGDVAGDTDGPVDVGGVEIGGQQVVGTTDEAFDACPPHPSCPARHHDDAHGRAP